MPTDWRRRRCAKRLCVQLQAAEARLAAAGTMLAGERGAGRLRRVGRALVARRARMVAQLASALGLGFHTGAVLQRLCRAVSKHVPGAAPASAGHTGAVANSQQHTVPKQDVVHISCAASLL